MTRVSQVTGNVTVEVLKDAYQKFGAMTDKNKTEYLAYVRTRVDQALKRKAQPVERNWTGDRE